MRANHRFGHEGSAGWDAIELDLSKNEDDCESVNFARPPVEIGSRGAKKHIPPTLCGRAFDQAGA
jgi:hypothetical protein